LAGLLDPLKVKDLTLRNRVVMPPMQTGRATVDGTVTDRLVNFYVRRSAAIGLLIVEHSYVSASGKLSPRQLGIYRDELMDGLRKLVSSIHALHTAVVVQITHAGGVANGKVIGTEPVGPSATGKARELTRSEMDALVGEFGLAAERAIKAGFDGVELHGAHGFLLNQFFSPLLNMRRDDYGGSLEKRMRFPLMVVDEVREKTGTKIEDSKVFAAKLEQRGVDVIDVSGGLCGSEPKQLRNVKGYFIPQASEIKKEVNVPVIGVGGITEPEYADKLIRDGKVDLVAVGRALWKDPKWAEKALKTPNLQS
jgi:NADPH2 dehydrogenase